MTIDLVGHLNEGASSSYLDRLAVLLGSGREYSPCIKMPSIVGNRRVVIGVRTTARATRSTVRQTFAARKAAKAADSGGSSDPEGRRPQTYKPRTTRSTQLVLPALAFPQGGAK